MKSFVLLPVMISAFIVGCASAPKMPREFDFVHSTIITGTEDTKVVIDGASRVKRAAKGAATMGGSCLVVNSLICLASGPSFPFCMAVLSPIPLSYGTAGAVTGAITSESTDKVEKKRIMLAGALNTLSASQHLESFLKKQLSQTISLTQSSDDKGFNTPEPEWIMVVWLTRVQTVGSGKKVPYQIQAYARLAVKRASNSDIVFAKDYQALSSLKLSTPEWRFNDDQLVRITLADLMERLATGMLRDMLPLKQNGHMEKGP